MNKKNNTNITSDRGSPDSREFVRKLREDGKYRIIDDKSKDDIIS